MTKITKATARKVLKVVDAGLVKGVGNPIPGQMCVEAAVCYALGLPHGDDPNCVSPAIRALKIVLNDAPWSSNAARTAGLRKLSILQLGTDHDFDNKLFAGQVALFTCNIIVADCFDQFSWGKAHAIALRTAKTLPEAWEAARSAAAAREAALAAQPALMAGSAREAARSAAAARSARSAARSALAARSAAREAARSARSAAEAEARSAREAEARSAREASDKVLATFSEGIADILISMKVPAVKWLDLLG